MDIIIFQDGLYHLIPATKTMLAGAVLPENVNCFNLCDILRENLTTYLDHINKYVMKEGGAYFYGCICK